MHRLIASHAPEFAEVGVTMAQAKVLYLVVAAERLRMSDLAGRLGISLSSTTGLVERLVELGLLVRGGDPADRRPVVVSVTDAGLALLERFRELNQRELRRLLEELEADELAIVDRSIALLDQAIDRAGARLSAADTAATSEGTHTP